MLAALKADPRASRQALLLTHLYADTDAQSLAQLRRELLPLRYTALQLGVTAGVATSAIAGAPVCAAGIQAAGATRPVAPVLSCTRHMHVEVVTRRQT